MLGLIDAINRFDPDREVMFSTYCTRRISGSILDELRRLVLEHFPELPEATGR